MRHISFFVAFDVLLFSIPPSPDAADFRRLPLNVVLKHPVNQSCYNEFRFINKNHQPFPVSHFQYEGDFI